MNTAGVKNGLLILTGEGVARVLMVLGALFAAKQIGTDMYGRYGVLWAEVQLAWSMIEFGTGMVGVRYLAGEMQSGRLSGAVVNIIALRVSILVVVMFAVALWMPVSWPIYALAGVYLLSLSVTPDWLLRASENFTQLGIVQNIGAIVYLIVIIPLSIYFPSVETLLLAHVLQMSIVCALLWVILPPEIRSNCWVFPTRIRMEYFAKNGMLFALSGALLQGGQTLFMTGVERFYGASSAGMVAVLLRVYQLVNSAVFMLAFGYYPRLVRAQVVNEARGLFRLMATVGFLAMIAYPLVLLLLAGYLLGDGYRGIDGMAWWIASGLLWGALRYGYSIPLTAQHRHKEALYSNLAYFLLAALSPFAIALAGLSSGSVVGGVAVAEAGALMMMLHFKKYHPVSN